MNLFTPDLPLDTKVLKEAAPVKQLFFFLSQPDLEMLLGDLYIVKSLFHQPHAKLLLHLVFAMHKK